MGEKKAARAVRPAIFELCLARSTADKRGPYCIMLMLGGLYWIVEEGIGTKREAVARMRRYVRDCVHSDDPRTRRMGEELAAILKGEGRTSP